MSEPTSETVTVLQQAEEEGGVQGRGEGEGEEKTMQQGAEEIGDALPAVNPDTRQEEAKAGQVEFPVKAKQSSVQSVFSLVRNQIRAQSGLEARRTGMLQLVQRVTGQLERSKGEQGGVVPGVEVTSPEEEEVTAVQDAQGEHVEEDEVEKEDGREEACAVLLQEVLASVESLRREVREELSLLRQESQRHTEQALQDLEVRLMQWLRTHTLAYPMPQTLSRPPLPGAADTKKHKPLAVLPLGAPRRRTLNRTMTTIMPKTCLPPSLGPRSMSEPLGARVTEATSVCSITNMFPRGGDPLGLSLGPLPPALPLTNNAKKSLRTKGRMGKPAS